MIEIFPSLLILITTGLLIVRLKKLPISQIFILIVVAYTTLFPTLDFLLSPFPPKGTFGFHQSMIAIFFIFPLLFFSVSQSRSKSVRSTEFSTSINLSLYVPLVLSSSAAVFAISSVVFDLFLVRMGYSNYLQTARSTPTAILYHYRLAIETSFFVIIYLISIIRHYPRSDFIGLYKATLGIYLIVFGTFFLINSRMQFILLVILLLASNYRTLNINFGKLLKIGAVITTLALALTLLRELVIEKNYRLDVSSSLSLIRETVSLIVARLNSVVMIDTVGQGVYNPFMPNIDGLWFFVKFNTAIFVDPSYYEYMKSIEITSPSVFVTNSMLLRIDVDFPKSMMVEVLLIFGLFGLPILAYFLSKIIAIIQRKLKSGYPSSGGFIVALYVLPLVLQFEKEFSGFLISLLKWAPMLIFIFITRPSFKSPTRRMQRRT